MEELEYFAGIDWGSEAHQVCVIDSEGTVLGERAFRHGGAGLAEMADWLVATTKAEPQVIGIAIEVPHGPVVETLMERGFATHALNPKQLDRFRDRFSPAGAKDDRRDSHTLGSAFANRPPCVQAPRCERTGDRRVARVVAHRGRSERRAHPARQPGPRAALRYYPQLLKVEGDLTKAWARDLWGLVPTPEKARRVRLKTVAALLERHRVRRIDADTVLETLREPAVAVAAGTRRGRPRPSRGGVLPARPRRPAARQGVSRDRPPDCGARPTGAARRR